MPIAPVKDKPPITTSFSSSIVKRRLPEVTNFRREIKDKIKEYQNVIENTKVLYGDQLLPDEIKKQSPVVFDLYNLCERVFPTTGIPAVFIASCLASMCTTEARQYNLLIGKATGEGGTLIANQFAKIPFVRAIFDSYTAAGFCMKYCGKYLVSPGSHLPDGVRILGSRKSKRKSSIDTSYCTPIDKQFFISKGMDSLFHQNQRVVEKTLTFFNPLFEEGYASFTDAYKGSFEIGTKDQRLKVGFIGICTLEDFDNHALKASGWTERIVMATWCAHPVEDRLIIQGINRKKFPECDLTFEIADILGHLNPYYPVAIESWSEEIAKYLDKFSEYTRRIRGEKKGKRAARDCIRILQSLPALNKRSNVTKTDLAVMDGLMTTMKRKPEAMGWRIPFQYAVRRWFKRDEEIIRDLRRIFKDWQGNPLYSETIIRKTIKNLKLSEGI